MSVRKIRSSWWVDFRVEGVRHRRRSPENSQAGAKAYEALLRQRLARGEALQPAKVRRDIPTFAEFAREWMETWVRANNKPSTARNKAALLRASLLPAFGQLRLNSITAEALERFKSMRVAQGRAPQTINNDLSVLRACLRVAADWRFIDAVPAVRWLRSRPGRVAHLSPDDAARLLNAAGASRWREMILLTLHTGLRYGELVALDWSDIDLTARRLSVRRNFVAGVLGTPKNHRERHIPLTRSVCDLLARREHRSGLVFASTTGRPVMRNTALRALHLACRRAGIEPIGWHALRHSFASHLVARGVPLPAVQQLLGHATIAMTMRYTHLAPGALVQAVDVLDGEPSKVGQPVGNAPGLAPVNPSPTTANVPLNPAENPARAA